MVVLSWLNCIGTATHIAYHGLPLPFQSSCTVAQSQAASLQATLLSDPSAVISATYFDGTRSHAFGSSESQKRWLPPLLRLSWISSGKADSPHHNHILLAIVKTVCSTILTSLFSRCRLPSAFAFAHVMHLRNLFYKYATSRPFGPSTTVQLFLRGCSSVCQWFGLSTANCCLHCNALSLHESLGWRKPNVAFKLRHVLLYRPLRPVTIPNVLWQNLLHFVWTRVPSMCLFVLDDSSVLSWPLDIQVLNFLGVLSLWGHVVVSKVWFFHTKYMSFASKKKLRDAWLFLHVICAICLLIFHLCAGLIPKGLCVILHF